MKVIGFEGNYKLENHGVYGARNVYWSVPSAMLYEEALKRGEGIALESGALSVITSPFTGRSPQDKYIVTEPSSYDNIWWGEINHPISEEVFDKLLNRMHGYIQGKDIFVEDVYAGADPDYTVPVRVITDNAWLGLFSRNMLLRRKPGEDLDFKPQFTLYHFTGFHALPELDGTRSPVFIIINFKKNIGIIGGTKYGGELKKSVFTYMNYFLPMNDVFSMHCSANVGPKGDVALFFGLSGTGKTTLSSDPSRPLIGDDEHGWTDKGVFNIEGGCYAKVIGLKEEDDPNIYSAVNRFGTILENVVVDPIKRLPDFDDGSITQNTRASYPLFYIPNSVESEMAGHPKNIFFLSADAFGVLPPIAKLTPEQAMYYYLSGYTAKVAGTERGLSDEPQATFSTCFAAPFLPLRPQVYAKMLRDRVNKHKANVWLVNTGWVGGPYGVGTRIKLRYTRAMITAALNGDLDDVEFQEDPIFGFAIPKSCPNVPSEVLDQRAQWKDVKEYEAKARYLAGLFKENFEKRFSDEEGREIAKHGPRV